MIRDVGRGVIVLGMHRSGTSAVTGAIDALGLPASRPEDRYPVHAANAKGNFESRSVSQFDDLLLYAQGGGRWWAPVAPPAGWADMPEIASLLPQASALFARAYPSKTWVWKDPRACMLLPFWDRVLGADTPRIVVLRQPDEIAESLAARERFPMPKDQALAITDRSLYHCLRDSAGRATLITRYDDLLADAAMWTKQVASFLEANGLVLPRPLNLDGVRRFVTDAMRHHRDRTGTAGEVWTWANDRVGAHESLSVDGLPPESPETEVVLQAARTQGHRMSASG